MMRSLTLVATLIGSLAAVPAAAAAQSLTVRNDSGETLTCRIYRRGRSDPHQIVLRAGQMWQASGRGPSPRALYCDPPAAEIRYRIQPGTSYRLVPDPDSVRIVLRTL